MMIENKMELDSKGKMTQAVCPHPIAAFFLSAIWSFTGIANVAFVNSTEIQNFLSGGN
jgi:hypothetical protein